MDTFQCSLKEVQNIDLYIEHYKHRKDYILPKLKNFIDEYQLDEKDIEMIFRIANQDHIDLNSVWYKFLNKEIGLNLSEKNRQFTYTEYKKYANIYYIKSQRSIIFHIPAYSELGISDKEKEIAKFILENEEI